MKGFELAVLATVAYVIAITVLFRTVATERRAAWMLTVFIASCPLFVLIYATTPETFGLPLLRIPGVPTWLDLGFGLSEYAAGFFGGTLQLYNLAERGFSLRLLIDIDESQTGRLTVDQMLPAYGGGSGIAWMYDKRVQDMQRQNLVHIQGSSIALTARGRRWARTFSGLATIIGLKKMRSREPTLLIAILSASCWFALFLGMHLSALHLLRGLSPSRIISGVFGLSVLAEICTEAILDWSSGTYSVLWMAVGVLWMLSLFILYMPFYYTVASSQSVDALIRLSSYPTKVVPLELLCGPDRLRRVVEGRVESMVASGLLIRHGDGFALSPKGQAISTVFSRLKELWRLGPGG